MRSDFKEIGFKPIHKRWVVERIFLGLTTTENYVEIMNINRFC